MNIKQYLVYPPNIKIPCISKTSQIFGVTWYSGGKLTDLDGIYELLCQFTFASGASNTCKFFCKYIWTGFWSFLKPKMDENDDGMFTDNEIMEALRTNDYGVKLQGNYFYIFCL